MNTEKKDYFLIQSLQELRSISPDTAFRMRMEELIFSEKKHSHSVLFNPLFVVRLAVIILITMVIGGTGVVVASAYSKPGDLLYPVKQVVQSIIKPQHQNLETDKQIPKGSIQLEPTGPAPKESSQNTPTPIVPSPTETAQSTSNQAIVPTESSVSLSLTPTPQPEQQASVFVNTPIGDIGLSIDRNSPTSSPASQTENDGDTPLLPQINIQLEPAIKIGL